MLLYLAVFFPDASIKVTVVKGAICASSRFGFQMITCEQKIVLKLGVVCIFILWISRSSSILTIFSSPDPKGHVSYCHHWASVVRPLTFHILINSTEATGPIWTKPKLCLVIPISNQDGRQTKNRKKGGWNFNCSYMARSSLTYIPGFFVKFFFQPIYTDYAN